MRNIAVFLKILKMVYFLTNLLKIELGFPPPYAMSLTHKIITHKLVYM